MPISLLSDLTIYLSVIYSLMSINAIVCYYVQR